VLANFAVWCGVAAPRRMALAAHEAVPEDAAEVERALLEMTNEDRRVARLPPLLADAHAASIARAHSEEMRDRAFISHVSPTTGSASDRARRGGLVTPLVLENLARAYSATEAHRGLMASPGHRANLLSPQATHLGIGVALGAKVGTLREVYVTELFVRRNPRVDLARAEREAAESLRAARARAGVPVSERDRRLDRIAQAYAAGLAAGQPDPILSARADGELDRLTGTFSQVLTVVAVATEVGQAIREPALDPRARAFGVGVGQGNHPEMGEGALYVVLLLARPR
jgi:hypothetical protein